MKALIGLMVKGWIEKLQLFTVGGKWGGGNAKLKMQNVKCKIENSDTDIITRRRL